MSVASQVISLMYQLRPPKNSVRRIRNIDVPSEDGIILKTDLYLPRSKGPHPTMLMRSPYSRKAFAMVADLYAERGYITILQAVRGTDGSTGTFSPLVNERADGLATLDWIKQQDWFDGRIAVNGPSYLGYCGLAICDALPEGAVMAAKATSSNFERIVFPNGAFHMQLWLSWMQTIYGIAKHQLGMTVRMASGDIERRTLDVANTLPLEGADMAVVGERVPFWQEWMNHAIDNHSFWEPRNHSHRLNEKSPPNTFVTGWYDLMQQGHLADYQTMVAAGHTPHLTIGPWHHTQNELQGESLRQTFDWLDTHLLKQPDVLRTAPVRFFITGSNRWHDTDSFPPQARHRTFFFEAKGRLGDDLPSKPSSETFDYDPADPTPNLGGAIFAFAGAGARDNRELEARKDVLTFTTQPLKNALTIVGNPKVKLYVTSSLPHADFFVRLTDVERSGKSINLADAIMRLKPDAAIHDPDLSEYHYELDLDLHATGHSFLPGHRIRLQVSGGAHPRYARNLGTDEPIATATQLRKTHRKVFIGADRASHLILPVVALD